jgi:DNA repair protein RadA/Sms
MLEFDRICGGGLTPGGVILLGGDPGIGKSTLLLQLAAHISKSQPVAYISGEEGVEQIQIRAQRLDVLGHSLVLASSTSVASIVKAINQQEKFSLVVVDSIQTVSVDYVESAPGTVAQIRASAHELIQAAKHKGVALILVGHVTKEGAIAGPRVLEHMVDTVLYFEGERTHPFRILRAIKNRFGPTDELGVFDMTHQGLKEVKNPSALFLGASQNSHPGSCVFAGVEGSRPLLVEVQALASSSFLNAPRRSVLGWDPNRLAMVLAVLETRCGINLASKDIYMNVVGGLRISEPAADLAVALALISCVRQVSLPARTLAFGELSLSGEIRPVSQSAARLKEGQKLGFEQAITPPLKAIKEVDAYQKMTPVSHVQELFTYFKDLG